MGVNNLKTSETGKELIKHYEGFSAETYTCPAGILTIGYGHTKGVKPNQTITEEQGDALLTEDLADAEAAVNQSVMVPLHANQFDALVSFVFNLGAGNFKSSTLLKKLNAKDCEGAANEFYRWRFSNKVELAGLKKRRLSEAELFRTGKLVFY